MMPSPRARAAGEGGTTMSKTSKVLQTIQRIVREANAKSADVVVIVRENTNQYLEEGKWVNVNFEMLGQSWDYL